MGKVEPAIRIGLATKPIQNTISHLIGKAVKKVGNQASEVGAEVAGDERSRGVDAHGSAATPIFPTGGTVTLLVVMATIVNANQPRPVRQATVSRATWHWVEWLLAQPAWKSQVAAISTEGATAHRQGLPYREAPVGKLIPDAARLDRWHGKQRSLAFLLPPSLRDLVGWLSLSPRLLVVVSPWSWPPARDSVVIAPGPPVNVARLERARRITLARLQSVPEDARRRRADAEAFRRFLRDIDPRQRPLLFTDALTTAGRWLATDEHVNTSATAAGDHGHFIACASQAGYPPLGRVATQAAGLAGVEPPQLPPSPRGRFIIAANGLT